MTAIRIFFALLFAGALITSCATRQSFQAEPLNEQANWWQCDPKGEREWRCSDGDTIEETTDVIQSDFSEVNVPIDPESQLPVQDFSETDKDIAPQAADIPAEPGSNLELDEATNTIEPSIELMESSAKENEKNNSSVSENHGNWTIQLAAFRSELEAQRYSNGIENSITESSSVNGVEWFRVTYGRFIDKLAAKDAARELKLRHPQVNIWIREID